MHFREEAYCFFTDVCFLEMPSCRKIGQIIACNGRARFLWAVGGYQRFLLNGANIVVFEYAHDFFVWHIECLGHSFAQGLASKLFERAVFRCPGIRAVDQKSKKFCP